MSKAVIAAGHVTDEAEQFLRLHGAAIGGTLGLTIIEVPEDAEICGPGYQSVQNEYVIQWPLEDGNDPEEWIEVELYLDAYKTRVSLRHASHAGEPAPAPTSEQQPFTYIQDGTEHQARTIDWDAVLTSSSDIEDPGVQQLLLVESEERNQADQETSAFYDLMTGAQ